MKSLTKKVASIGLAAGLMAIVGCGDDSEMKYHGYKHLSPNKIEYNNGFVAEGIGDDGQGNFKKIVVDQTYNTGTFLEFRTVVRFPRVEYNFGDKYFQEIQEDIRNRSAPLQAQQ